MCVRCYLYPAATLPHCLPALHLLSYPTRAVMFCRSCVAPRSAEDACSEGSPCITRLAAVAVLEESPAGVIDGSRTCRAAPRFVKAADAAGQAFMIRRSC